MDTRPVWAFDVDGTLVGSIRSDVLRPGAAELLALLEQLGVDVVVWSAGGADHARRMLTAHGLDRHCLAFYSKQGRDAEGRFVVDHLSPAHRPTVFVDDQPDELPRQGRIVAVSQFFGGNRHDRALVDLAREIAHPELS